MSDSFYCISSFEERKISNAKDSIDELVSIIEKLDEELSEWRRLFCTNDPENALKVVESLKEHADDLEEQLREQKEISKANLACKVNTDF